MYVCMVIPSIQLNHQYFCNICLRLKCQISFDEHECQYFQLYSIILRTIHDDHYLGHFPHCRILQQVWRVSLDSMDKCLVKSSAKKGTSATLLHQRLFTALQTMRDFFHCEGDGLDDKELDSEKYKVHLTAVKTRRMLPLQLISALLLTFSDPLLQAGHPSFAN